jgi:hypothetical protein
LSEVHKFINYQNDIMKTKLLTLLIFAAIIFATGNANAQVRHRAVNQHHRIKQGVKSGELTKAEARNLRKDQRDVRKDVKEAKSDGKVTAKEKRKIEKEQRKDSREIYRKKHNLREQK